MSSDAACPARCGNDHEAASGRARATRAIYQIRTSNPIRGSRTEPHRPAAAEIKAVRCGAWWFGELRVPRCPQRDLAFAEFAGGTDGALVVGGCGRRNDGGASGHSRSGLRTPDKTSAHAGFVRGSGTTRFFVQARDARTVDVDFVTLDDSDVGSGASVDSKLLTCLP